MRCEACAVGGCLDVVLVEVLSGFYFGLVMVSSVSLVWCLCDGSKQSLPLKSVA